MGAKEAEPVALLGATHLDAVAAAYGRPQADHRVVLKLHCATRLEEVALRVRHRQQGAAARIAQVVDLRRQRPGRLGGVKPEQPGQRQRQGAGAEVLDGGGIDHRVKVANRLPVGPAGGVLRHGQQAVRDILPLGADQELAVGVVVGAGHKTSLAVGADGAAVLHPQIVVGQEEQIMGQLVGQRPLPIPVQLGQVHAKGVPVGPHADLAREVGVGDGQRRADDVIGEVIHHAPHAGARPDAILGIDDNV